MSYANPQAFPHSQQNVARCSGTWNQNANEKMRKGKKNTKEERKRKPKMSREQKPVGTAGERTITTISRNSTRPPQTEPKKNNCTSD
jgi:hypothetical protein